MCERDDKSTVQQSTSSASNGNSTTRLPLSQRSFFSIYCLTMSSIHKIPRVNVLSAAATDRFLVEDVCLVFEGEEIPSETSGNLIITRKMEFCKFDQYDSTPVSFISLFSLQTVFRFFSFVPNPLSFLHGSFPNLIVLLSNGFILGVFDVIVDVDASSVAQSFSTRIPEVFLFLLSPCFLLFSSPEVLFAGAQESRCRHS